MVGLNVLGRSRGPKWYGGLVDRFFPQEAPAVAEPEPITKEQATVNLKAGIEQLGAELRDFGVDLVIEDSKNFTGAWLGDWRVADKARALQISAEYITVSETNPPFYVMQWSGLGDNDTYENEAGDEKLSLADVIGILRKNYDRRPTLDVSGAVVTAKSLEAE